MTIRRAELSDAGSMVSIASAVNIERSSTLGSGLVEYRLSEEDYKRRIEGNPLAFVAATPVAGFILSYYSDFLRTLCESDERARSDEIIEFVSQLEGHFVYADQLCVLPKFQGQGIAFDLYEHSLTRIRKDGIPVLYGAIAHAPWRNEVLLGSSRKRGYRLITEITAASGLTFGIYGKEIKRPAP